MIDPEATPHDPAHDAIERIEALEAELKTERARVADLVAAVNALPVEDWVEVESDGSPTLLGYVMQAQGEWDAVRASLSRTPTQSRAEIEAGALDDHAKELRREAQRFTLEAHGDAYYRLRADLCFAADQAENKAARIRAGGEG